MSLHVYSGSIISLMS